MSPTQLFKVIYLYYRLFLRWRGKLAESKKNNKNKKPTNFPVSHIDPKGFTERQGQFFFKPSS